MLTGGLKNRICKLWQTRDIQRFHIALVTSLVDARCLSTLSATLEVDKCNASTKLLIKTENAVTHSLLPNWLWLESLMFRGGVVTKSFECGFNLTCSCQKAL
jgi:hypothetical protein